MNHVDIPFPLMALAFLLVIYGFHIQADEPIERTRIHFSNKTIAFLPLGKGGEFVSEDCIKKGQPQCLAVDALKRASFKNLEYLKRNPAINLGAAICTLKTIKGVVLLGEDEWKNHRSFCLFDDGSMVENSTLFERAQKNDNSNQSR